MFAIQQYTEPEVLLWEGGGGGESFSKFVADQANKVSNKEKFTKHTDTTDDVL